MMHSVSRKCHGHSHIFLLGGGCFTFYSMLKVEVETDLFNTRTVYALYKVYCRLQLLLLHERPPKLRDSIYVVCMYNY